MMSFAFVSPTPWIVLALFIFGIDSESVRNFEDFLHQPETYVQPPIHYDRYEDTDPYWQFGSKTVYNLENTFQPLPSECKPMQIFMINRHGTRHSANSYIEKMTKLKDLINKMGKPKMNEKDVENLKNWEIHNDGTIDKNLSSQGVSDMKALGKRVRAAFTSLLDEPYDPENGVYKVVSAPKPRCVTSAEKFMQAALGDEELKLPKNIDDNVLPNLYVLKEQLLLSEPAVEPHESPETQIKKFKESDTFAKVLSRVATKMDLQEGVTITLEQLETIYESCRQVRATNPTSTPVWCTVFVQEDLKVLEYMDDLGWYYSFGYGCPIHEKIACHMLKQLKDSFKEKAGGRGPKGVFHFAHRSNMIVTAVMLGVAKDIKPLTYDNMDEMKDRNWRTSKLNPFGANMTAVLCDCGNGEMKVSFYINEVLTRIELGDGSTCDLCSWELVEKNFDEVIQKSNC
ncbi:multiple inositol polyphosphate phosphatase 1-like isoform X2 [Adelges cooleyi]|uniref:multiple inositol polyphosphate phosphatase 1-like isoform X2 n=1 Tax=Adelges cooleyi TaxID=133065 RepID=UPI0021801CAB|nr:multiple inositol polyphosphate phosphatase 1-like isoform X2 [Adelges cooleyi]